LEAHCLLHEGFPMGWPEPKLPRSFDHQKRTDLLEKEVLKEAMLRAYPDKPSLNGLIRGLFGIAPHAVHKSELSLVHRSWEVVDWADGKMRIKELVEFIVRRNPELAPILRSFDLEVELSPDVAFQGSSGLDNLERSTADQNGTFRYGPLLEQSIAIRGQVCYISGSKTGTGFLVAADLVLTNYHVVQNEVVGLKPPSELLLRFDYLSEFDRGIGVRVAATSEWCVARSPYAPGDAVEAGRAPAVSELDYALLRLADPVGRTRTRDNRERGWIELSQLKPVPRVNQTVNVIQHPNNEPLSFAAGRSSGITANGLRFHYQAETKGGSSGSPVFAADMSVVGLHQAGAPGNQNEPGEYNQGIPLGLIMSDLESKRLRFWS